METSVLISLTNHKSYFFDLDGCIYYGNVLAPGANELLELLRSDGKTVGFITNNSRQTADEVAVKLRRFGLQANPGEIVTATEAVGAYLAEAYGSLKVKAVGSDSLTLALEASGHTMLADRSPELADYVVLGRDLEFTYEKLQWIALEVWRGAKVIAANPDLYHPGLNGERIPETGALAAAVEAAAGITAESVGKPGAFMFELGMKRAGSRSEESAMVGDNPATDILGAKKAGMTAVWIAGHAQPDSEREQEYPPDVTVPDMQSLYMLYKNARERA